MSEQNKTYGMIFPGQGSQAIGMLSDLATEFEAVSDTFEQASDRLGYDLWDLVQNGPEEKLNQTEYTQPALLAAGMAAWRAWQTATTRPPAVLAGHSLGEYTALVAAGAIGFTDAIELVATRGRLMQSAVPAGTGSMAALLGLDDDAVVAVCEDAGEAGLVAAANFNAPGQVVIAGEKAAVAKAVELAKEKGARRAMELAVSVPSHCALMEDAAAQLLEKLSACAWQPPEIPVVHNVDVAEHSDVGNIRNALREQLYRPVRWVDTINAMDEYGVEALVECGPGKVLAGLCKRINRKLTVHSAQDRASIVKAVEEING